MVRFLVFLLKGIFAFLTSTLFLHFAESFAILGLNRGVCESQKTVAVTGFFDYQSFPDTLKITLYIGFEIEWVILASVPENP